MTWATMGKIALTAGVAILGGTPLYWTYVQGDPRVIACEPPFTNDGAGNPKTTFKPGDTLYTQRNDRFANKVTGSIQRAFIRDDGMIVTLPLIMPPKLTPDGLCSKANFATVIPKDLPAGMWTYSVTVFMRKNPMEPVFAVPFAAVRFKVE
jgi:hypothetical protein